MLPENIGRSLPKLAKLILDDCSSLNSLPVALGSLKDLKHISVKRCAALVNPPRSQQLDPIKTAKFMISAYSNNEHWRRVKVLFYFVLIECGCSLTRASGSFSRERAQRQDLTLAHSSKNASSNRRAINHRYHCGCLCCRASAQRV